MLMNCPRFFEECDGIIALGNASFEPEPCAAYGTWFTPRPVYFVGPLVPDDRSVGYKLTNSQERELNGSSNGAEVKSFLDTIQKTHGDYSLLYVRWLHFLKLVLTIFFTDFFWFTLLADGRWRLEGTRSRPRHENSLGTKHLFSQLTSRLM